jgi:hypothetical protein
MPTSENVSTAAGEGLFILLSVRYGCCVVLSLTVSS